MPRKPADPAKKARFAKLMGRYKKYDPKDGPGSVNQWRDAWNRTMGCDEARAVLGTDEPLAIMGLAEMPTRAALKTAYRKLMLKHQTAFRLEASTEEQEVAKRIIAAYSLLDELVTD